MFNGIPYMNKQMQDRAPAPGNNRPQRSQKPKKKQPKKKAVGTYASLRNQQDSFQVSLPVVKTTVRRTSRPNIQSRANGDILVRHRELYMDVIGVTSYPGTILPGGRINPGRQTMFPWLSRVAQNYESFRFNKLAFTFESASSYVMGGTFAMAIEYDTRDDPPESKVQLLAYRGSVRCNPAVSCTMTAASEDLGKRKSYFVAESIPVGADPALYDVGLLYQFIGGTATNSPIGELYVEYEVQLLTPQLNRPSVGGAHGGVWTGTSNSAPFSTPNVQNAFNGTVTCSGTTTSLTQILFGADFNGLVTVNYSGTGLSTILEGGNATRQLLFPEIGFATQISESLMVTARNGDLLTLQIDNSSITRGDLIIAQCPVKNL